MMEMPVGMMKRVVAKVERWAKVCARRGQGCQVMHEINFTNGTKTANSTDYLA